MEDMFDKSDELQVAEELAHFIASKYGLDTVILDLRNQASFTDFFIIVTARSEVHQKGLIEAVTEFEMTQYGRSPLHAIKNNVHTGGWAIIDYRSIVVHIFSEEQRKFYDLEKVWFEAPRVQVRTQQTDLT